MMDGRGREPGRTVVLSFGKGGVTLIQAGGVWRAANSILPSFFHPSSILCLVAATDDFHVYPSARSARTSTWSSASPPSAMPSASACAASHP